MFSEPIREAPYPGVGTVITNRNNGFDFAQEEALQFNCKLASCSQHQVLVVSSWRGGAEPSACKSRESLSKKEETRQRCGRVAESPALGQAKTSPRGDAAGRSGGSLTD